jgi:hypothetical protein
MSVINGIVSGLLQNPSLVQSLIKDPKTLAKAAGIGDEHWSMVSGIGSALSGLVGRVASSAGGSACVAEPAAVRSSGIKCSHGGQGTAIAGVLSLVAVTGAIAVLATVTSVALSSGKADAS